MIIALHPPDVAGPLRRGATGQDAVATLQQLGTPLVLCRAIGSRPGYGVHRPSGLFIGVYFDAHDHVEAIELDRPADHRGRTRVHRTRPATDLLATSHPRNARP